MPAALPPFRRRAAQSCACRQRRSESSRPVASIRRTRNEYRLGNEFAFFGIRVNWLHGWEDFKEDTPFNLSDGNPHVVSIFVTAAAGLTASDRQQVGFVTTPTSGLHPGSRDREVRSSRTR